MTAGEITAPSGWSAPVWRPERWLGLLFACALLLPPLPFPFGNAGIHVAPLAALLGIIAGFLRLSEWRTSELKAQRMLPSTLALFLLILLLSVAFAAVYSGWEIALGSLTRVLLLGIAVWVFFFTWIGPRGERSDTLAFARLLFWIALLGAAFACVDFYFQFPAPARYGAQFMKLAGGAVRRAQGVFYESSTLGNFCAFFLVMTLAAVTGRERRVLSRAVLLPGALIFAAALMLSASRASVVTVIVATIALLCMRRAARAPRISRRVVIGLAVSLVTAAEAIRLAAPEFWWHYWRRTLGSLWYLASYPDGVLAGRLTHWNVLADFVRHHPWHIVFGIGYKTLPYTNYLGAPLVADNTYLSLLVETGVIGLAVFVLLNVAILRTAYRAARSPSARASFFGLWIFCFWCGELVQMLSGDLITYWRVLPVYFWVLAAALRETACSD